MTIRYKVLVKDADEELKDKLEEEYCCYGSIGAKFKFTERTPSGYKTTRRFTPGRFEGIKLELAYDTPYGQSTTKHIRDQYERMFESLGFYNWLGGGRMADEGMWYSQTRDDYGRVDSITFKKGCPMFLAVAATGVWRLFANAANMFQVFHQLKNLPGINPIAAFSAAVNVDASSMGYGSRIAEHTFRVCHYQTHMPWGHRCMDVRATARILQLTHEDFKSLPSMYDEQRDKDNLVYDGRDNWFFGTKLQAGSRRADPSMNYLSTPEWQEKTCTPSQHKGRWESRRVTGESLIKWCTTLSKESELLKGYDLQQDRATTRGYINEAKKKEAAYMAANPPAPLDIYGRGVMPQPDQRRWMTT